MTEGLATSWRRVEPLPSQIQYSPDTESSQLRRHSATTFMAVVQKHEFDINSLHEVRARDPFFGIHA